MAGLSIYTNSVAPVTALVLTHSTVKVGWNYFNSFSQAVLTGGSGSISSTVITVDSTVGLTVGGRVTVTAGTGSFTVGTTVLSISNTTTFIASLVPASTISSATITSVPTEYSVIRLVRNQYAFSETQEDGEILYEFNNQAGTGLAPKNTFTDGVDASLSSVSLVSGQYAYYTIWVLLSDSWINAGNASVLVPKQHGTYVNGSTLLKSSHTKVMEILPKVLTSVSNSPFDVIDQTSDLYKFMKGVSLTYDEILTYADLTVRSLPAKFISDSLVLTAFKNLGLRVTSNSPTIYKKNLISKAPSLLSTKGTKNALSLFVETYTGFNTTVSAASDPTSTLLGRTNLLLNQQDSSFHKGGIGSWKQVSNAALTVESSTDVPLFELYSFKSPYRLKITTAAGSGASQFRLGSSADVATGSPSIYEPLGYGIPIEPGNSYSLSWMTKFGSGTATAVVPFISWYDAYGTRLPLDPDASSTSTTSTWTRLTYTATAPGKRVTASSYTVGTSSTSITTSTPHGFTSGDKVYFEDEALPFKGAYTTQTGTTGFTIILGIGESAISLSSVSSAVVNGLYVFTIGGAGTTENLKTGHTITVTSGTGTLGGTTKITSVISNTKFIVDVQPTVALSGATISASTYTLTKDFTVFKATSAGIKESAAEYAMIGFKQAARSSVFYIDAIQFGLSSYVSNGFIEVRCCDIYVEPTKYNFIPNPTFKTNTGWSGGTITPAATTLTGVPYSSTTNMVSVQTPSSSTTYATADLRYETVVTNLKKGYHTFSIYLKGSNNYPNMFIGLYSGSAGSPAQSAEVPISVTTEWKRYSVTLYTNYTYPQLIPYVRGTRSSYQLFYASNPQLEEGQKATDYFDWTFISQEAEQSNPGTGVRSVLYVNKAQKMSEISLHITDWVPLNSTWMVRSVTGIEAIGVPNTTTVTSSTPYSGSSGGGNALLSKVL
jgi:hypothetical protein